MTDLVTFLRARLDERERDLKAPDFVEENSAHGPGWGNRGPCPVCDAHLWSGSEEVTEEGWWDHAERVHDAKYVLADVEAKRRIIDLWSEAQREDAMGVDWPAKQMFAGRLSIIEAAVRRLALPHADHPDYDETWRP